MKYLIVAGAIALASCAAQTQLGASQDFGKAQVTFNALQQAAVACITSQVKICTDNRAGIIAANDKGQIAETTGYTAQQAHNQPAVVQATTDLLAAISALQALGVAQ